MAGCRRLRRRRRRARSRSYCQNCPLKAPLPRPSENTIQVSATLQQSVRTNVRASRPSRAIRFDISSPELQAQTSTAVQLFPRSGPEGAHSDCARTVSALDRWHGAVRDRPERTDSDFSSRAGDLPSIRSSMAAKCPSSSAANRK
jgi:hypothetical protein